MTVHVILVILSNHCQSDLMRERTTPKAIHPNPANRTLHSYLSFGYIDIPYCLTPGLWARAFCASRHAFQWLQRPLVMSLNSVHLFYHPVTQKVKYQSKQYRYQIENETYWVDLPAQRLGSSISQPPKWEPWKWKHYPSSFGYTT